MNTNEYLLTQAASECMEVAHRITKALHFGLQEVQPGQNFTNAERIVAEYVELLAVMQELHDKKLITLPHPVQIIELKAEKVQRVYKFMNYARHSCGTVRD